MNSPQRWFAAPLGALILCVAAPVPARAQHDTSSTPSTPLAALAFLAGSCWKGTFPDRVATDEHCFAWVYDGKFLRDRHVVRNGKGPYEGESIYAVDGATRQVAYTYWNSEGDVMRGTVEARGDSLVFPTRYDTPGGPVEILAVWTRLGPDRYRVWQAQKVGDQWKPFLTMEMTRLSKSAP
jgi:hypothetical protein